LFGEGDKSDKEIDGESFLTFTPNTITYAVGRGDLQNQIRKAKIGIVFHTKYEGDSMQNMKASFNVSRSDFGKSSTVYADDANFRDVSGKSTFTAKEYKKALTLLKKCRSALGKARRGSNAIAKNPKLTSLINIYTNAKVKSNRYTLSAQEFTKFVNDKLEGDVSKLKTKKGQERRRSQNQDVVQALAKNAREFDGVFKLNMAIQELVMHIVNKLDEVKTLRTFVRTANGFRVTSDEGFVASRSGTALKLVNRLEFSRANFTVAKNWVKG
jgi:hypothetical protein